jgi:hypothetical protein
MDESASRRVIIGRHPLRPRPRPRLKKWQRTVLKSVVRPLLRMFFYLADFVCTRWEVVPVEEYPEAKERWKVTGMDREHTREWLEETDIFLCPECHDELKATHRESTELFTDVWEIKQESHCERCAADRHHCLRVHHGHLAFLKDGRWMVALPRVPWLRRWWLWLRS